MAKVSIGIPAYYGEEGVARLLRSIGQQEYEDYEVVITDDSGDDRIGRLAEGKKNVRYYKNEVRLGAAANWNRAMRLCTGEYMKIMHHDDWFTAPDAKWEAAGRMSVLFHWRMRNSYGRITGTCFWAIPSGRRAR